MEESIVSVFEMQGEWGEMKEGEKGIAMLLLSHFTSRSGSALLGLLRLLKGCGDASIALTSTTASNSFLTRSHLKIASSIEGRESGKL